MASYCGEDFPTGWLCIFPTRKIQFGHETLSILDWRWNSQPTECLPADIPPFVNYIFVLLHPIKGSYKNDIKIAARATAHTKTMTSKASMIHQVLIYCKQHHRRWGGRFGRLNMGQSAAFRTSTLTTPWPMCTLLFPCLKMKAETSCPFDLRISPLIAVSYWNWGRLTNLFGMQSSIPAFVLGIAILMSLFWICHLVWLILLAFV